MNLASRRYYQMRTDGVEFATLSKKLPKASNVVVDNIGKVTISFPSLVLGFQVFPCWSITWHRTKESLEAFSTLKFNHEVMVTEVRSPDFSFC